MKAKGLRRRVFAAGKLHVFSDKKRIVLQVRVQGPDDDPLVTWAKAGCELTEQDALQLASELLSIVAERKASHAEAK